MIAPALPSTKQFAFPHGLPDQVWKIHEKETGLVRELTVPASKEQLLVDVAKLKTSQQAQVKPTRRPRRRP